MNKASESIQFSLIALIFAAAALRCIVLQAPLSQSTPLMKHKHFLLLQNMGLEINSRVSTGSKNESGSLPTKSFVEHVETKIASYVSKVVFHICGTTAGVKDPHPLHQKVSGDVSFQWFLRIHRDFRSDLGLCELPCSKVSNTPCFCRPLHSLVWACICWYIFPASTLLATAQSRWEPKLPDHDLLLWAHPTP